MARVYTYFPFIFMFRLMDLQNFWNVFGLMDILHNLYLYYLILCNSAIRKIHLAYDIEFHAVFGVTIFCYSVSKQNEFCVLRCIFIPIHTQDLCVYYNHKLKKPPRF